MIEPRSQNEHATLYLGDCIEVMRDLPDSSVHAVVTDPPYGIGFMGHAWDQPGEFGPLRAGGRPTPHARGRGRQVDEGRADAMEAGRYDQTADANRRFQAWCEAWAAEAFRVLKPGGYLLSFGSSRTSHRLAAGIEDAGFSIRDTLAWLYGSGFPKSVDVSKAIDKRLGRDRPVVEQRRGGSMMTVGGSNPRPWHERQAAAGGVYDVTGPASDEASQWHDWGSALKPGFEPIIVARKPFAGTLVDNVLQHGTGALNLGATRVPATDGPRVQGAQKAVGATAFGGEREGGKVYDDGRFPPNVLLSHLPLLNGHGDIIGDACEDGCAPGCPVAELDRQQPNAGASRAASGPSRSGVSGGLTTGVYGGTPGHGPFYGDTGGASRFFPTFRYTGKAPGSERPSYDLAEVELDDAGEVAIDPVSGEAIGKTRAVAHPTVKPLGLMQWCIRLVTPPGGTVLEPFAGSGTTVEAAIAEGFEVIAIEREAEYAPLIEQRMLRRVEVAGTELARRIETGSERPAELDEQGRLW